MTSTVADGIRSRLRVRRDLLAPAECRRLRENAGLSQQELGAAIGVTKQAISHWESGIRTPRGTFLDRYVEALRALREAV